MPQNTRRYFEESEDLLEGRSPESYGSEFAALMRSKLGPKYQHLASPEKIGLMGLIGDPKVAWNYAGMNYGRGLETPEHTKAMAKDLAPVLDGGEMPKGKRIFGIGSGANAATYAHELRHENVKDEMRNRVIDLVHGSTSLPAYKKNIQQIYNYITNFDYKLANIPIEEKEKKVLSQLGGYINLEKRQSEIGAINSIIGDGFDGFIKKNLDLNKSGAVGGTMKGKTLPESIIEYRARMPFLNFIGRLEEPKTTKKASGGSIEKTTHDRKII